MLTSSSYDYLCVDQYLKTFVDTQALKCALDVGLLEYLSDEQPKRINEVQENVECDGEGLRFLLELLVNNQVLVMEAGNVALHEGFLRAWRFRDFLKTKVEFANLVAPDLMNGFTSFIADYRQFMANSKLFELFDYQRAIELTEENYRYTERWMRLTTVLTRYESQACLDLHDFSGYKTIMDIGGNSGEFVLRILQKHKGLHATVVDLPVVCEVGAAHLAQYDERDRVRFIKGNALSDNLPGNMDIVSFKSFLHDWPEPALDRFFEQARRSLRKDGTLLIFERGPIPLEGSSPLFINLPTFLFFRSYRPSKVYEDKLYASGFYDVEVCEIQLETPFLLITAKRK